MAGQNTFHWLVSCAHIGAFDTLSNCFPPADALFKADLIEETSPIISVYLGSKAGRAPKKARNDHRHHASVNIVAHKSSDYVCNSDFGDRKLRSSAPKIGARLPESDAKGVVVSANQPPKSTFLAPAVVEYCVARSVGCMVLGPVELCTLFIDRFERVYSPSITAR